MKKRLSVWLSCVLVMVLVVSFSVPVYASQTDQWVKVRDGASGTLNLSRSNASWFEIVSSDQYLTDTSGSYQTGQMRRYFFRLINLSSPGTPKRTRVNGLSVSYGTTSNTVGGVSFWIGSYADVVTERASAIPFGRDGYYHYDGSDDYVYLWCSCYAFDFLSGDFDFSLSMVNYSFDSVEANFYGTDYSINQSIDALNSSMSSQIQNQTTSVNNQIAQQTQNQTNTLTKGYDSSGMNADNEKLSSSLDSYDGAESQVTDQANGYIDAVTFFDPTTHLQLMACMTYTATFLQDLFVALGDWSILIMIALSLAFALMLIGWFKYRK